MKSFIDVFVELAEESDKLDARRTAKVLEKNGVDSIERLLSTNDETMANMPGIGPRSMNVIGKIKTAEKAKAEKKTALYKKTKGKEPQKDLKYYFQKAGCSHLESCNIESILRKNGCKNIDKFVKLDPVELESWKYVGAKRLEKITAARSIIMSERYGIDGI